MLLKSKEQEADIADKILGVMFILCILIFIIANIITGDRDKSDEENRSLAQIPVISSDSIIRGTFMEQFETYLSDQFAGRDTFRRFNVILKSAGGSRKENDVFLGKDGQLMKDIVKPDDKALQNNLEAINTFVRSTSMYGGSIKTYMLLVPDSAEILKESLPKFACVESERELFDMMQGSMAENLVWIDGISVLNKYKAEKIYYKTDHHWTTLGAWHMFCDCAGILGIYESNAKEEQSGVGGFGESDEFIEYNVYTVTGDFNGVLSSNSGFCLNEREEIEVYIPKDRETSVILNYVDEQKRTTSLYDTSKLEQKDKYSVFLGGNSSLIDIRTTAVSDKTILVIKDSFANSFIPFMIPYYKEVIVVDPRYYSETIWDILDTYDVSEVLFLYSGNTFLADNHIAGFLD